MPVTDSPVVSAPMGHHVIDIRESAPAGEPGCEPGSRPAFIGSFIQYFMYIFRQVNGFALCNLQHGAYPFYKIQPAHGDGHAAPGNKLGGIASPAEITVVCRVPGGGLEACIRLRFTDLPEGFHGRLMVNGLPPATIQGGGTRIDEMYKTFGRGAFRLPSGNSFHRPG